jgi:hypothetical protein
MSKWERGFVQDTSGVRLPSPFWVSYIILVEVGSLLLLAIVNILFYKIVNSERESI